MVSFILFGTGSSCTPPSRTETSKSNCPLFHFIKGLKSILGLVLFSVAKLPPGVYQLLKLGKTQHLLQTNLVAVLES
ncbi:hypothetical protein K7X08_016069 [Anisodus acutangulus]|uniref:Uncharacterized protein n=1 Tax=Anisodus acutangulus TaxID=402998 RepID=A0A9Q1QYU9_9SOLA|nr:hypothetical protein K7X08_016069 [Anisodus acutangulus]